MWRIPGRPGDERRTRSRSKVEREVIVQVISHPSRDSRLSIGPSPLSLPPPALHRRVEKCLNVELFSFRCSDVPTIGQHHRLLLRISGQDDDPKRRRRRGVSADRRKDLTMTISQGVHVHTLSLSPSSCFYPLCPPSLPPALSVRVF